MKRTVNILRILSRHTGWWTLGLIVLLAISLTLARVFLPQLERYHRDVEMKVSSVIGQPVSVAGFEVGWRGFGPRLLLHDVRVMDRGGDEVLMGFDSALIDISVPDSLYQGQIEFGDFTLVGVELQVVRDQEGQYSLKGVELPEASEANIPDDGEGKKQEQEAEESQFNALAWVFRQPHLALEDSVIRWRDEVSDTELKFDQVNFHLQYVDGHHLLGGKIKLPSSMGHEVGDVRDLDSLDVKFYLRGAGLQFTQWLADHPALRSYLGMRFVNGTAQLELWGRWHEKRLKEIKGDIGLYDIYLAYDEFSDAMGVTVHRLDSLSGHFSLQIEKDKWQLDVDRFTAVRDGQFSPPARIHIEQITHEGSRELEIATNFARVEDFSNIAVASSMLSNELRTTISELKPQGEIHDAYVKLSLQPDQPPQYFVSATLKDLGMEPWKKVPGVEGFDVTVNIDQQGGVADIETNLARLDTQGMFREVLLVDSIFGRFAWQFMDEGLELDVRQLSVANKDLDIQIDGAVDIFSEDVSPMVNLAINIKRGDGAATQRYLPVKKMHPTLVSWLDSAIVGGEVTSGAMVLQGPIRRFPFLDGSGRFEVRFNVSNGILDYTEGWPRIEEIDAEVGFVGGGMDITAHSGKMLASTLENVEVEVSNFRTTPFPVLMVDGDVYGDTSDVIRYLNESPLNELFGTITSGTEASGASRVGLSLGIPLKKDELVSVDGWVSFDDSSIALNQFGVDLVGVNGKLNFNNKGMSAEGITAEVMGQPATLNIRTDELSLERANLVFEASGDTRLKALSKRVPLMVFDHLGGKTNWQATLEIPLRTDDGDAEPTMHVTSDLIGVSVNLPSVLAKKPEDLRRFGLYTQFGKEAVVWNFDYGEDVLSGVFEVTSQDGEAALNRAELHVAGPAVLPEKGGFRLAGKMDKFDSEQWWPIIFSEEKGGETLKDENAVVVDQLDFSFTQAELFGQTFHNVELSALLVPRGWSADVDSDELKGNIKIPDDFNNPLIMDLARLYIPREKPVEYGPDVDSLDEFKKTPVDPRELPPLNINSVDTRFGAAPLGRMQLVTERTVDGLKLEALNFSSPLADIKLHGDWEQKPNSEQAASIVGDLLVYDLGSLIGGFDYAETIKHGEGTVALQLSWDDSLLEPDLNTMDGMVNFDFNDGQVLEVEPGAGRFFGLISVQALSRRLKLDFSDLFGKGLAFDYMRGRFDIAQGNAVTDNFALGGPAADATLSGRVGMADRDYDQQLKVVPHVTSGLPLATAVLSGVNVGAVVLLIEKLLKPKIDEATEVYYHITGSWDDPVMTRLPQ
ncbi:YhdP family protein [Pseudomonadota bacterium]